MKTTLVLAAAALALTAPAFAQVTNPAPTAPPTVAPPTTDLKADTKMDGFAAIDTDKNGSLSLAEVKIHDVTVTQADFDKYDADKSKSLSKAEFDKWSADMKAKAKPANG